MKQHESKELQVEIISKKNIKPASPTPPHLRTYNFSFLDQLNAHFYVPLVYFYPNEHAEYENLNELISERRRILKHSLSQTLSHFYPFAGKVDDNNECIDCNDDGVCYVEARVNYNLSSFLSQPKNHQIHCLLPFHPDSKKLLVKTYVVMIQVSIFVCGGIAIGMFTSHKIIDGPTHLTFLKSWAAIASGSPEKIIPCLIAPSIFPQDPAFPKDALLSMWPSLRCPRKNVTRRFVFDGSRLIALRAKIGANPSRVMAVTGLIWRCAMFASKAKWGYQKPSVMTLAVNLRERHSPPLPPCAIGNIYWSSIVQLEPNSTLELGSLTGSLRGGVEKFDSKFVEDIKAKKGSFKNGLLQEKLSKVYQDEGGEYFVVTSWCNAGIYGADFGWGKPIWSCLGNAGLDLPISTNLVHLIDARSGDGIEAWITLDELDMKIMEQDPELLEFASLDPSPFVTLQ